MPDNADSEKKHLNEHLWNNSTPGRRIYFENRPKKIRLNAVHAIEFMMTASPDFQGDWNKYFDSCKNWVQDFMGSKNILSMDIHRDEKTPHLHILAMPMKDGKLNAKYFLGGSKFRMRDIQNDFYKKCGQDIGLERGLPKEVTKARHAHYTAAANPELIEREEKLKAKEKEMEQAELLRAEREKKWADDYNARVKELNKKDADIESKKARLNEALKEREQEFKIKDKYVKELLNQNSQGVMNYAKSMEQHKLKNLQELFQLREQNEQQQQSRSRSFS